MYYVKPLTAEDIHYVASIMSETNNITALHSTNHSLAEWKCIYEVNSYDADEENFLICVDNNICAWLKLNGLLNADTAWISMLVVSDKYKHQGVGKFAVEYAFEYLHSKGFKQIGVQTTKDNVAATNLYKKCGFNIVELKKFKAEDGTNTNSYVMLKTLESKKDIKSIVQIINDSYTDISVNKELIKSYTKTPVYNESLWIMVEEKTTGNFVGCGLADYDTEAKELILEWIQVLPEYRGKKIGQLIVTELLFRMRDVADFATVSGKVDNATNPEALYRKCGFVGTDVWHILHKK